MENDNAARDLKSLSVVEPRRTSSIRFFRIRDFERLQHYKDRSLVWVKLYVTLLDDYEFLQLPDHVKYQSMMLTLLAARSGNKIPNDPRWVAGRIGATEPVDLDLLFQHGFLEAWQPRPQEAYREGEQLELPEDEGDGGGEESASNLLADSSGPASNLASNLLAQNRTEQNRAEEHTDTDTAPASAGRVCECCGLCVHSAFSYADAFRLARQWRSEGRLVGGRPIENVGGLARTLHREGTADADIELLLRPPPPRQFGEEPCPTCRGTKYESHPGKGTRRCPDCVDEAGEPTGRREKGPP